MNASPHSPRQRKAFWQVTAAGVTACLAATAGGYVLGVSPALDHLTERRANLDELATRRQKAIDLRADAAAAAKRLVDARREVADLPLRLEPASAVNRRLNRLAEAAAAAGVALNEMQPQPAADGRHYQTVPIRVAGTGSYPACAAFLHALRAQFPDTAVRSVDATNAAPGRTGNVATFRLELDWHTAPATK